MTRRATTTRWLSLGGLIATVILTAAWSNNRQTNDIARRTGATVVELPNQVKGADWAPNWIALMDGIHTRLAEAYELELQ